MDECPWCQAVLSYEREGETYSHGIMVEVPGVYDGGLYFACPFCGGTWHRWTSEVMRQRAERFIGGPGTFRL